MAGSIRSRTVTRWAISSPKSIPDSPFEFLVAAFDRSRGLEGMSSIQPASGPILPVQIGRLAEEVKGPAEQPRSTRGLPTSSTQDSSHDVEIDTRPGVDDLPQLPPILLSGPPTRSA